MLCGRVLRVDPLSIGVGYWDHCRAQVLVRSLELLADLVELMVCLTSYWRMTLGSLIAQPKP